MGLSSGLFSEGHGDGVLHIFALFVSHEGDIDVITDSVVSEKPLKSVVGDGFVPFDAYDDVTHTDAGCFSTSASGGISATRLSSTASCSGLEGV